METNVNAKDLLQKAEQRADAARAEIKRAEEQIAQARSAIGKDRDYLLVAVLRVLRELRSCADGSGTLAARRLAAEFSGGPLHIQEGSYTDIRNKIFELLVDFDLAKDSGEFKFYGD